MPAGGRHRPWVAWNLSCFAASLPRPELAIHKSDGCVACVARRAQTADEALGLVEELVCARRGVPTAAHAADDAGLPAPGAPVDRVRKPALMAHVAAVNGP